MKYGSVCSGIEAASVAWKSLGWESQWYSEIEHFPSAVLAHRFPSVPNLGDMTKIHEKKEFQDATINILVGGTPCQSFSIAGLRKGLDDSRGGLMLSFVELAARKRPSWVVWENVPGVLSSNGGRDFATFLGLLTGRNISSPRRGWKNSGSIPGIDSAYGVAWRILDAQYFGVAQRRRRVFLVGHLGDWRPAAAVLFEQDCLSGNTKKSKEKRQGTSADVEGGIGGGGKSTGTNPELMATLCAKDNEKWGSNQWVNEGKAIVEPIILDDQCGSIMNVKHDRICGTLRSETHRHEPIVAQAVAYEWHNQDSRIKPITVAGTLNCNAGGKEEHLVQNLAPTITASNNPSRSPQSSEVTQQVEAVHKATMAIRRLTPTETERLQGFPDGWTKIPYRNKSADQCPDGPRYKACGNSMAVPCMAWIGKRIEMVAKILNPTS
jgi:DNA (cytosine-5)-methyltransferase 1